MTTPNTPNVSRRTVLRGAATAAIAASAAGTAGTAAAQSAAAADYGGWLENTSNYDGTADRTGEESVTITVGAAGNNGNFAFGPAAVSVDPGTTVVWKWNGKGGSHDVAAEDGSFRSEMVGEKGHTFERTFDAAGVVKYACTPHRAMGMRGVIVVGDAGANAASSASADADGGSSEPDYDDWFDGVSNFEGTADRTGEESVTVTVGARGNNGSFAFDPPAVRVDPGTRVVWEWNGKGGAHNVVAEDGAFESEMVGEKGYTFEQTFDSAGVHRYVCVPHEAMGMRGAVVVGAAGEGGGDGRDDVVANALSVGGGVGLVGALLAIFAVESRNNARERRDGSNR